MELQRHSLRDAAILLGTLLLVFMASVASIIGPRPASADTIVLVIAAPWNGGADHVVEAAGGQLVGPVSGRLGTLADFSHSDISLEDLSGFGAWAVRDASKLAALCGVRL